MSAIRIGDPSSPGRVRMLLARADDRYGGLAAADMDPCAYGRDLLEILRAIEDWAKESIELIHHPDRPFLLVDERCRQ